MQTTESQTALILRDLSKGDKITHLDAQRKYQCARLVARVRDLRKRGFPVVTTMIPTPTGKRVAEYSLPAGTIVMDNLQKAR